MYQDDAEAEYVVIYRLDGQGEGECFVSYHNTIEMAKEKFLEVEEMAGIMSLHLYVAYSDPEGGWSV